MFRHLAIASAIALLVPSAQAATFTVDTSADTVLSACDANTLADCTLRGAITAANANASVGPHDIGFNLPASDPNYIAATQHWRIAPATNLPALVRSVRIDGYTQAGATSNTNPMHFGSANARLKIELRGTGVSGSIGLVVGDFLAVLDVRGLAINGFDNGIRLFGSGAHHVEGCFIGTDISGQLALPNRFGVLLAGAVTVGGLTPAARNVISGNSMAGLLDNAGNSSGARIQGNFIGPAADGSTPLPGQDYAIQITAPVQDMLIGGNSSDAGNILSASDFSALYFSGGGALAPGVFQVRLHGNYIGTDVSGTAAMGNGLNPASPSQPLSSIYAFRGGSCGLAVGGDAAGEGNLIAFGGAAGVQIATCRNAPVLGNNFVGNRGLPIDLSLTSNADGRTANDVGDVDASGEGAAADGGNRLQNTVELVSVTPDLPDDTLQLVLRVDANTVAAAYPLRVDIYRSDAFGTYPVATESIPASDAQQLHAFALPLSMLGTHLAFTVTDADGNTSELVRTGAVFADGFEGDAPAGGGASTVDWMP